MINIIKAYISYIIIVKLGMWYDNTKVKYYKFKYRLQNRHNSFKSYVKDKDINLDELEILHNCPICNQDYLEFNEICDCSKSDLPF